MDSNNIKSEILTTKGIKSIVYEKGDLQKHKILGHIGLFDFDGKSQEFAIDSCMYEPGINVLLKSSENSYHVYNLTIKHKNHIALDGLRLRSDPLHVGVGYREGRWVLRTFCKEYEGGEIYKSSPKLITMWFNKSKLPQSRGHFKIIRTIFNIPCNTLLKNKCKPYKWVGCDLITMDEYMTITDNVKSMLKVVK